MFYVVHHEKHDAGLPALADKACTGEHDVKPVATCDDARAFDTWGEASDFAQNFGADWGVAD